MLANTQDYDVLHLQASLRWIFVGLVLGPHCYLDGGSRLDCIPFPTATDEK